jgi:hypothetical protein
MIGRDASAAVGVSREQVMTSIVISDEQVEIIKKSPDGVELRSPNGECLGVFKHHGWSEVDIQLALKARASGGPYYTTAEVLAHLKSLEDREKQWRDLRSSGTKLR